ncbi:MAG: ABC transporter permease [Acidobacteriaceae bacterium]|nr:ABC transporter permease [Acidobacteriaceae bacterium]
MSVWSRLVSLFRTDRLHREIDEELNAHIQEAIEQGRDPAEARQAFGSLLRYREQSRDLRLITWIDSLRADLIFACRQLRKRPGTTAAAILSLALAIGSCTSVFRLIDALLLRPLPVQHADRLYAMVLRGIGPDGSLRDSEWSEYPQFLAMRAAVKNDAELICVSGVDQVDLTFASDTDMERAHRQWVSGWMFNAFGIKPALGRLLTPDDDVTLKAKPFAVLSYDYWSQRFGRDPAVIGRKLQLGNDLLEIVGVAPAGFTGTEPGTFTDIFLPNTMYEGVTHDDWAYSRVFIQLKSNGNKDRVRDQLQAVWSRVQTERAKGFTDWPAERRQRYLQQQVVMQPAAAGLSYMQHSYRVALAAIAVIVALVLVIACSNIANLLTAQAVARSREMALRVSIGAGKARLVQLVLVESALLAALAALVGAWFASWSAPLIVASINPPDNPARLSLPADWRVLACLAALSAAATLLFGLLPALRASSIGPAAALKGGDNPHSRRRLMYLLIATQVAFCFVVHFAADAFVSTLHRLSDQPTGFSSERLLTLETVAKRAQPIEFWFQACDHLRDLSGVESVAIADVPLLSGMGSNGFVSVNAQPPSPVLSSFLNVSPGWLQTMNIPLLEGRDLRRSDTAGAEAMVNLAFAREYFHGEDPVGRSFARGKQIYHVIALVRNAKYRGLREPLTPVAYIPFSSSATGGIRQATFLVRTSTANPYALAPALRREVSRARPELRVSNVRTQEEINQAQTIRERLLAGLAGFFAAVALLLAAVGLYGVLDYSVLQRRRELGLRIAIGASGREIARQVALGVFETVLIGAVLGGSIGLLLEPRIKTLLYDVSASDWAVLATPLAIIVVTTLLTAIPAVIRGIRIDPVEMLRAE